MRKISYVFVFALFVEAGILGQNQQLTDSTAIIQILDKEINAWNLGDAVAYSQYFAPYGTFTNILGQFYSGYQGFLLRHEQIFNGIFKGTTMKQELVSLRFVTSEVVVAETRTIISGMPLNGTPKGILTDKNGKLCSRLLQVLVKTDGKWMIEAYHNVDIKQ